MKPHIKALFVCIIFVFGGAILSKIIETDFSPAMLEQAKAISYFVTLAGIVTAFSWYKRTATPVESGVTEIPEENQKLQKRVLLYMIIINFINGGVLILSTEESIQMMTGISLLVVIISPIVFRSMQEKDAFPLKDSEDID